MRKAGVAQLKASLSEYLAAVKAGVEVLVTEHGRPVARIVPVTPAADDREQQLVREGLMKLPERPLDINKSFWSLKRPRDRRQAVRSALAADREEGR